MQPKLKRQLLQFIAAILLIFVAWLGYLLFGRLALNFVSIPGSPLSGQLTPKGGRILAVDSVETIPAEQVLAISKRNYGASAPQPVGAILKATVKYNSYAANGDEFPVYARIYLPTDGANLPIFAFAPGTTGLGDQCAASLEQPTKANWADYESHAATYAGQGYAVVITDYEGMRDPNRLHHYMVGELEGRSVLDSIRALENWNPASSRVTKNKIVLGGFSQGGHSTLWADKIAASYAPEMSIKGVVGFGPVSDVKRTLIDATRHANINWFGPFVLASYSNYYKTDYGSDILLPQRSINLSTDTSSHCIDSVVHFWGMHPEGVYTPAFIQAMNNNLKLGYQKFNADLEKNAVGDQDTLSAKLINQGQLDNVILPAQQTEMQIKLCRNSRGSVNLKLYPQATHYNIMAQSLRDTLAWMAKVDNGAPTGTTCP